MLGVDLPAIDGDASVPFPPDDGTGPHALLVVVLSAADSFGSANVDDVDPPALGPVADEGGVPGAVVEDLELAAQDAQTVGSGSGEQGSAEGAADGLAGEDG